MNTIKISAVLTAALLTGALSATAFAAETLTTTTGSITFRKAIDVTNAAGAGGITGTIAFDVTAADESDLPDDGEKNYVGSVDQLDGSDIIATFAADDSGIVNKESDVSVGFDTSKFEAPGIYYYHLTERDPGIHGLTATTSTHHSPRPVAPRTHRPHSTSPPPPQRKPVCSAAISSTPRPHFSPRPPRAVAFPDAPLLRAPISRRTRSGSRCTTARNSSAPCWRCIPTALSTACSP